MILQHFYKNMEKNFTNLRLKMCFGNDYVQEAWKFCNMPSNFAQVSCNLHFLKNEINKELHFSNVSCPELTYKQLGNGGLLSQI